MRTHQRHLERVQGIDQRAGTDDEGVIGDPTAGWIIYTSNFPLVDGSVLRIPFIRITAADGSDMELEPRPVDVPVTRAIGEGLAGKDSQLDAAVAELMRTVGARRVPAPSR